MNQHRLVTAGSVRAKGDRTFTARVLSYDVIDTYDTIFDPGCATDSLKQRMPIAAWSHDWAEPIGRATRVVSDDGKSLVLEFRLDDPTFVPRAGQAYSQLKSGTIDNFSVGFRTRESYTDDEGIKHFKSIGLDEVSLVLVGAVPGTELLSVRAKHPAVRQGRDDYRQWIERQYRAGRITRSQRDDDLALDDWANGFIGP